LASLIFTDSKYRIDLSVDGWMEPHELEWLAEQASKHYIIVEVGCFVGRTTKALADNTQGIVFAIDPWCSNWKGDVENVDPPAFKLAVQHADPKADFMYNLKSQIEQQKVIVIQGFLADFLRKADMIFLDGDHTMPAVENDIKNAIRRLNPGGLLCGHDYNEPLWPDVTTAVNAHFTKVDNPIGSIWCVTI